MLRPRVLVGFALLPGFVTGHQVAYLLAPPSDSLPAVHHGYLELLATAAVPLGLVAAVGALILGRAPGWRSTAALLALLPVTYLAVEIGEHVLAGASLVTAGIQPSLWVGAALQLVIAGVAALVLRTGAAIGAAVRGRRPRRHFPRAVPASAPAFPTFVPALLPSAIRRRGPPGVPALT